MDLVEAQDAVSTQEDTIWMEEDITSRLDENQNVEEESAEESWRAAW